MNMRKIIAVLAAVLMLCSVLPLAVSAAPGDVIIDKNFDDGSAFSNGSNENGYMVFDATTADWANVYLYANAIKSGTKYEISFDCKANKAANINVKINNNWAGDTFKWTTNVTTEWATYTCVINPDELATLTGTALLMFTSNTTKANGAVYHIDNVIVKEYLDPATIGQITNGDFETGDLSGWEKHQSTVISTDAHSGSYAANLKGNGGWGGMLNQDVSVTAGKNYEISLWVKANAQGTNVQIKDGGTSGANLASKWYTGTSWSQLVWTVTPTTDVICINFCGGGTGSAEDVLVDDIVVRELKDPSFDGFIYNGDFETGSTAPWDIYSTTAVNADAAKSGDYGMMLSGGGASYGGIANQDFTVVVGKTYVVRFDMKVVNAGVNVQVKNAGTNVAGSYLNKTEWTTYSYEFTATATNSNLNFCGSGIAGTDVAYLDNVLIYEKVEQSNDGYIVNGTFDTGVLSPWENLWGSCPTAEVIVGGKDSTFALYIVSGQWKHVRQLPIAVEANTDYKITLWAKNAKDMSLLVKDSGDTANIVNKTISGGEDWTENVVEFNSGANTAILISFMGNTAEAYGTFDSVVMEKLHVCEFVGEVTEEPTCDLPGTMTYSCTCGEGTYTEEIPAWHNGNLTHVPAVDAIDCANPGHIEYYTCPWCNEYFTDANASEMINPWFINITVDCVKPESVADCANWTCETCGNENFGAGEHDTGVPACQDGHCSKCDQDIAGYGCANYDTPACGDGVCYYCGGFVAGLGHENGAWAPCQIGECSYGCGLTYPATAEHVDEDADDYCDTCWNHLNHDVDPCVGGECSICWTYIEGGHTYDNEFDVDCNVCGAVRAVVCPLQNALKSISEDVSGYAVKFDCAAEGFAIKAGTFVQADYTNATYNGYKLISLGVKASNGVSEIDIEGLRMYDLEDGVAKFAFRVINIPADKLDVEITMTPYYTVEIDGVETTLYGEAVVGSYAEIAG